MIGLCECCDRKDVPVSRIDSPYGELVACFLCQGDSDPDPYGELAIEREQKELKAMREALTDIATLKVVGGAAANLAQDTLSAFTPALCTPTENKGE